MSEIEAKRKELIEEWIKEPNKSSPEREWDICRASGKLDGFNLGVEMARKEIIDLLNNEPTSIDENIYTFIQRILEKIESMEEKK